MNYILNVYIETPTLFFNRDISIVASCQREAEKKARFKIMSLIDEDIIFYQLNYINENN